MRTLAGTALAQLKDALKSTLAGSRFEIELMGSGDYQIYSNSAIHADPDSNDTYATPSCVIGADGEDGLTVSYRSHSEQPPSERWRIQDSGGAFLFSDQTCLKSEGIGEKELASLIKKRLMVLDVRPEG